MQNNALKPKTPRTRSQRVGRGGKRGKTAGRGTKGQNARAGRKKRPEMRDIIKKLPKMRGRGKSSFKSFQKDVMPVSLTRIAGAFRAGETVSPKSLAERGLVSPRGGRYRRVKVLGGGAIGAVTFEGVAVSAVSRVAIEKGGGSVAK